MLQHCNQDEMINISLSVKSRKAHKLVDTIFLLIREKKKEESIEKIEELNEVLRNVR